MLFAVASALVNCTNSYDYEEPDPKMVELAKYAKQHVPEQHPKVRDTLEETWGLSVVGTTWLFVSVFINFCCEKGSLSLCGWPRPFLSCVLL